MSQELTDLNQAQVNINNQIESYINQIQLQLDSSVKVWQEFSNQLKEKKQELEQFKQQLTEVTDNLDKKFSNYFSNLQQELVNLQGESFVLSKIPEKIAEQINQIIPNLSKEILYQIFKDANQNLSNCNQNLDSLASKIKEVTEQVSAFHTGQLKKKIISFGLMITILIVLSSGTSYLIIRKFPSSVWLSTKGDVHIDNSEVLIRKTPDISVNNKSIPEKPNIGK